MEHSKKTWRSRWENRKQGIKEIIDFGSHINFKTVKHVHENLIRFLKDLDDEGIPKSLPNPDLKAIAMDSDAGNSIKAGSPDFSTFDDTLLIHDSC